LYGGASAEIGYERFMKSLPNTALEVTGAVHGAFATSDDKFPSGLNGNPIYAELRVGAHYYYDFDRKKPGDAGARK